MWGASGSILGPLPFIIYTNSLPEVIHHSDCETFVYTDDPAIITISDSTDEVSVKLTTEL